jgi:hypothetical protein
MRTTFVNVGMFHFRPLSEDERRQLMRTIEEEVSLVARASQGYRGLELVRIGVDELVTVWHCESVADWEAAPARFGPLLQEDVIPNLVHAPDRFGGAVVKSVSPKAVPDKGSVPTNLASATDTAIQVLPSRSPAKPARSV